MSMTVCRPESAGISSAGVLRFLDALEKKGLQEHAVCVIRHGKVVLQYAWAPYREDEPHMLFSMSKAFTSCAAGIAIREGRLWLDSPVLPLLKDDLAQSLPDSMERITLRHLLTMTSGLSPEGDKVMGDDVNWAERILSFPLVSEPGETFRYHTMASYLLSLVIQRAVGETICDYLTPRLFNKLGISAPRWGISPQGAACGGTGLYLTVHDVALFGQMLLNGGVFNGERILDATFLQEAVRPQADSSTHGIGPDWTGGYGYQFWPSRHGRYRADGMNGQVCLVAPDKNAVIATVSGLPDLNAHMEILHGFLNDAFDAPASGETVQQALRWRLSNLTCPLPEGLAELPDVYEGVYEDENGEHITLCKNGDLLEIQLPDGLFIARRGNYEESSFPNPEFLLRTSSPIPPIRQPEPYAAAYGMRANVLDVTIRFLTYSYTRYDHFAFDGSGLVHTQTGLRVTAKNSFFQKLEKE